MCVLQLWGDATFGVVGPEIRVTQMTRRSYKIHA